jgi:CheY-like chemotaxis protein
MSAQQFRMPDLVALVRGALQETGLPAEYLELELTESLILESAEKTIQTMRELKKLGVSLSLDDFGTGYSSLSYLRHYPVDRIKIDQSFIRDMTQHPGSAALVRSILAMASNLGLTVIAEGVESLSQYGYLRKQFCEEMQGYLFSRPVPEADMTNLLQEGRRLDSFSDAGQVNTVLLVDDEPLVLSAMRRAFHHENWNFLTASSAAEAFELLAVHEVGVIISDQRMPGMTGTVFLHRAKEMYPDAVRILLTGHADYATVIGAVNEGDLYKVLSKPIDDKVMRENIREALRRHEVFLENRRLSTRLAAMDMPQ